MVGTSQYVTIGEAAQLLGVSRATLRNWDKAGKLVAHRDPMSRYRLYSLEEIGRLLQEGSAHEQGDKAEVSTSTSEAKAALDSRALRLLIRQMSRAFRDSMGGGLLERFEEISKLLYCKLYDERAAADSPGYEQRFRIGEVESLDANYQRVASLYKEAAGLLPHALSEEWRRVSDDKQAVVSIVGMLQDLTLTEMAADVKGTVYEELIRNTFDKSENQQFFTPRPVISFMVQFAQLRAGDSVCDPACGSGGFLIEVAQNIAGILSDEAGDETRIEDVSDYLSEHIVGLEVDRRMAWIAQMNLMMHGDGRDNVHHLPGGGSLAFTEQVDALVPPESLQVILTNPPFGSDFSDIEHLSRYCLGKGKASRRRGILFIERSLGWLEPGGQLGIIIDESVLNGSSNVDVRRFIMEACIVEAVISLPDVTFMPYSTAKSSILFLRKRRPQSAELQPPIFMADVENVGRKPNGDPLYARERDKKGRPVLINDLPEVLEAWQAYQREGESTIAHLAPKVFTCPPSRFSDGAGHAKGVRLDVQHHHPSRKIAERTLDRAVCPTPTLAELVVVRNFTTVPNVQDPDDVWTYLGLAGITALTGEYMASEVMGSQIRSAVRQYQPGDILFSRLRPELRKCVFVRDDEGYVSSECLVLCPLSRAINDPALQALARGRQHLEQWEVDGEYLAFILRSDIVFGQLVYQITGVGRPRVNQSAVLGLRIPLPSVQVQREIVAAYQMAWQQYLALRKESEKALLQGESALASAYEYASNKLCPDLP